MVRTAAGAPVAGARVELLVAQGELPTGSARDSEADGSFELRAGVATVPALAIARTAGRVSAPSPVLLVGGDRGAEGIRLTLAPGGDLVVRVTERDGRPVGVSARVLSEGVDIAPIARRPDTAPDPERGQSFGPLPPGTYRVEVENHDRVIASETVRIVAGEEARVVLVLGG